MQNDRKKEVYVQQDASETHAATHLSIAKK